MSYCNLLRYTSTVIDIDLCRYNPKSWIMQGHMGFNI